MGTLKKSPLLEDVAERFGQDANMYDVVVDCADRGSPDADTMLRQLHQAMTETGVIDDIKARRAVGNFVLRLTAVMAEQGGPASIEIGEEWEGIHPFLDTYDRYIELAG